jgi:hypothetical protein
VIKIASIVEDDPIKHDGLGNDQHLSSDRQGDAGTLHNTLMNHEPWLYYYGPKLYTTKKYLNPMMQI